MGMNDSKRPPGVMLYFAELRPVFTLLSAEERGDLLMKIFDYAQFDEEPLLDARLNAVWPLIRRMIDRDAAAYQSKCDRAQKSVQARWERERAKREKSG